MSQEQREALDELLRQAPLDLSGDVLEQRAIFEQMMAEIPPAADITTEERSLAGIPAIAVELAEVASQDLILYFHGGAYAIGSAASGVGLASEIARSAGTGAILVDYRLAPEHPFPAAVEDAVAAYRGLLETTPASRVAFAGESAGGGLVIATLLALKDAGLPQPSSALVISPWVDLAVTGESIASKAEVDPALTPHGLRRRARDYAGAHDLKEALLSPLFGSLTGLPPLLIQVCSHEILLDDATRLATRAAAADVAVTLEVTPLVPHVFPAFSAVLDEGAAAVKNAGTFLRSHFSSL